MSATTPTTVFHGFFDARIEAVLQALAERLLAGPEPPRHLFVDHDHRRRALGEIRVLEHASANDAHLHRFEEAGDDLIFGQRRRGIVGPLRRPAVHGDAVVGLTMDEEVAHGAGGDHPRQRPNPADRVGVVRADLGGVVVRARQIDLKQQDVFESNPRSVAWTRRKLRVSSPAPDSRMTASAISATTSAECSRRRLRPPSARGPSSLSTSAGFVLDICSAGSTPATSPLPSVAASRNSRTLTSSCTVSMRGSAPAARVAERRRCRSRRTAGRSRRRGATGRRSRSGSGGRGAPGSRRARCARSTRCVARRRGRGRDWRRSRTRSAGRTRPTRTAATATVRWSGR